MKTRVRQAADSLHLRCPWLILVEHDLYGIAERITAIESGYFIIYDSRSGKYEVHSADNKRSTYCFTVPYDQLDARTLDYCRETLIANTDQLLKRMEANNRKIDEAKKRDFMNQMESASYETAQEVSLALDKDELHGSYKRTHGGISI